MFALVDCNNFYASCERIFRPELNGKPIVVLSNNDGCVIARSNEAKALGIKMGTAAFKYQKIFKQKKVHVFSANFALYGDMSNRVMNILEEYSPETEIYSIDEIFFNLKGFENFNLSEYAETIRVKVLKWTGIPVSIGIASTKSLAKVATRIAKIFPEQTNNVYIIKTKEERLKALKWLEIKDIWGIGKQYAKLLNKNGLKSAYDFTIHDNAWVKKNMGIIGLRLQKDLQGTSTLNLEIAQAKKTIATTRSFEKNYTELEELKERVSSFAVSCAEKLRKQKSCCNSLVVFIQTNSHRKKMPQYSQSITIKLSFPSNSSIEIAKFANLALEKIFKKGFHYKKAGVIVQDFNPENISQTSLFENRNLKHIPLMQVIDKLNTAYGQQKIRLASQDLKHVWKMKQEKLSPQYTTKLLDIIKIYC